MEHIKSFDELYLDDIEKFCNDNLAYILDDGFMFRIRPIKTFNYSNSSFYIVLYNDLKSFKWDDIKNDFIPFLQLFSEKYKTNKVTFTLNNLNDMKNIIDISYDKIINDKLFDPEGYWKDNIYYRWTPDPDIYKIFIK